MRRKFQDGDPHRSVYARYIEVIPRPGEDVERMIRRFTKKVRSDGILKDVVQRSRFEKPSERRRRKSAAARYLASKEKI